MNKQRRMRQEKGITLIALIITIVVLLILAVVAIRAVQDGGIIDYAKNARDDYQAAQEKEEGILQNYLDILNKETKTETEEVESIPAELATYILGPEGNGKNILEKLNFSTEGELEVEFIDDETTDVNEREEIVILGLPNEELYIKYNNIAYRVDIMLSEDENSVMVTNLSKIYEPQGREGKIVEYDSNGDSVKEKWIVITDRDGKTEIVNTQIMGDDFKVTCDSTLTVEDIDGDGITERDYEDIGVASYNNAITKLNNYCNTLVTATDNDGVRSLGYTTTSRKEYSSEKFNQWYNGSVPISAGEEPDYVDEVKILYWDVYSSECFWLAQRYVREYDNRYTFNVRSLRVQASQWWDYSLVLTASGLFGAPEDSMMAYACPVVVNPSVL